MKTAVTRAASGPSGAGSRCDFDPAVGLGHYRQAGKTAGEIAADANERLRRWPAAKRLPNAQKTWSEVRGLNALGPEDSNQPERMPPPLRIAYGPGEVGQTPSPTY